MRIKIEARSDVGCVRGKNEDMAMLHVAGMSTIDPGRRFVYVRDGSYSAEILVGEINSPLMFAVADGMGGHQGGDVASEMVLKELSQLADKIGLNMPKEKLKKHIEEWVVETHKKVLLQGTFNTTLKGMGSTLSGIIFNKILNQLYYYHVGDSRIYSMRGGFLRKVTSDHTLREQLGTDNVPSNIITNSIGGGNNVFIDFGDVCNTVEIGDVYLLCSDGLMCIKDDVRIEIILKTDAPLSGRADMLIDTAKNLGASDNITLILIEYGHD